MCDVDFGCQARTAVAKLQRRFVSLTVTQSGYSHNANQWLAVGLRVPWHWLQYLYSLQKTALAGVGVTKGEDGGPENAGPNN